MCEKKYSCENVRKAMEKYDKSKRQRPFNPVKGLSREDRQCSNCKKKIYAHSPVIAAEVSPDSPGQENKKNYYHVQCYEESKRRL